MAKIHKLTKGGKTIYPATTTDAVVHPTTRKNLTEELSDMSDIQSKQEQKLNNNISENLFGKSLLGVVKGKLAKGSIGQKISFEDKENKEFIKINKSQSEQYDYIHFEKTISSDGYYEVVRYVDASDNILSIVYGLYEPSTVNGKKQADYVLNFPEDAVAVYINSTINTSFAKLKSYYLDHNITGASDKALASDAALNLKNTLEEGKLNARIAYKNIIDSNNLQQNKTLNNKGDVVDGTVYNITTVEMMRVSQGDRLMGAFEIITFYDINGKFIELQNNLDITNYIICKYNGFCRVTIGDFNAGNLSTNGHAYPAIQNYLEREDIVEDEEAQTIYDSQKKYGSDIFHVEPMNLIDKNYYPIKRNYSQGKFKGYLSYGYCYIEKVPVKFGTRYNLGYQYNPQTVVEYNQEGNWLKDIQVNPVYQGSEKICLYQPSEKSVAFVRFNNFTGVFCEYDENNPITDKRKNYSQNKVSVAEEYANQIVESAMRTNSVRNVILRAMYPSLVGITWNALGDSYTANIKSEAKRFYYAVAEIFNIKINNYGVVSDTYIKNGSTGGFCIRYAEMEEDAQLVTVMGGVNDPYSQLGSMEDRGDDTIYGACHILFKGLLDKYPTARIGVILQPQNGKGQPSQSEQNGYDPEQKKLRAKEAAIKEVAEYYSIPVLDLTNGGGISGISSKQVELYLQGDYLHYKTDGYDRITPALLEFVKRLFSNL